MNFRNQGTAFLIGSILMLPIFFGRDWVPGNDSYYHLVMARFPLQLALSDAFPWLHWTLFRDQFVNHHLGFQCLLFPFVAVSDLVTGDLVAGGQVAVLLASGASALCLYRLLVVRGVPYPLAWTLLLGLLPWHYWLRQSYVRAPIIALPMMLVAVELFMRRKPYGLALWAALFMLAYFGAVLFALLVAGLLAGRLLVEGRWTDVLRTGFLAAAGLAAGFMLHPSFPENIAFMKVQLFDSGLSAASDIGNEWRPPDAWFAMSMWLPLLAVWTGCLVLALRNGVRMDGDGIALVLLGILFIVLTAKMRRFVEYAPVFVLLGAADLFRASGFRLPERPVMLRLAVLLIVAAAATGPLQARLHTSPVFPVHSVQRAMDWLKAHTPEGSLVLTDDWDEFPFYFHFNRHNRFAVGLDPMFTAKPYPEHWRRYKIITRGQAVDDGGPGEVSLRDVRDLFLADYLLVRSDHAALLRQALASPWFSPVYPDEVDPGQPPDITVFAVLPGDARD